MSMRNLLLGAIIFACAWGAAAAEPTTSIRQLRMTRWLSRDGAPSSIFGMAQSPDGFLWLASSDGLTRFDGVKFDVTPPVDDGRSAKGPLRVLATRSGEIWVAEYAFKGVSVFKSGRLASTRMPHPAVQVTELFQDGEGSIWAVNARATTALSRFRRGRWEELGAEWGVPNGWIFSAIAARDGSIWLVTMDKLAVLPRGSTRFLTTTARVTEGAGLAEDGSGRVWISDRLGTRRLPDYLHGQTDAGRQPLYPPVANTKRAHITFAPDGSLWGVTQSQGVFRIESPARGGGFSRFTAADGLSDDGTLSIFADREGTVWVGSERGLTSFVATGVASEDHITSGAGHKYLLARSDDGVVYVSDGDNLTIIEPGRSPRLIRSGLADIQVLCPDRQNGMLLVRSKTIERLSRDRTRQTFGVGGHEESWGCGVDRDGRMWLTGGRKLAMRDATGWHDVTALIAKDAGIAADISIDRAGRALVNIENRSVMRMDGPQIVVWSEARLALGEISVVQDSTIGLLVSGGGGMARIRGQNIQRLDHRRIPLLTDIRAIAEGSDGKIWLFSNKGLIRVSAADLDRAFDHPDQPMPYRFFTELDGLRTHAQRTQGAQAAVGPDGRLWFLGNRGVVRVRPADIQPNLLPPSVVIRSVSADNKSFATPASLPAGTRNLAIAYTALSLRTPERVAFRYKLDGVDKDWINPGKRREAFYTNLAPGTYRFSVIAANDDGVWNRTGATTKFTIAPTFTQSWIFLVLCGVALAGLAWLFFTWRLRVAAGVIRARMSDRIAERERIARELHDTLLQGVQALILRFQLIADDIPMQDTARSAIEHALDSADGALAEARDRVSDLRVSAPGDDFASEVDRLIQSRGFDPTISVTSETIGIRRTLDPQVSEEILQIVGEALFNALRHANPTRIQVQSVFRLFAFAVSVTDDGAGVDSEFVRGGRPGHFGLAGMRERARRLRARLTIDSEKSVGTKVTIVVPGAVAYSASLLARVRAEWRQSRA